MLFYHIIPLKTEAPWFTQERIFYFQLGKRHKHELLIEQHYQKIIQRCSVHGLTFVFHKYLVENIHQLNKEVKDYLFLNEISGVPEQQYYDELAWQGFSHQVVDPVYIIRRYDEKFLIAWGYHAFRKSKRATHFPFEALLPLSDIFIGPNCQFDVMKVLAKRNIFNLKID